MPETESWVSRGTSPAVEAGDCLGPISERRRYPIGAVNGAPETSVNAGRLSEINRLGGSTRGRFRAR